MNPRLMRHRQRGVTLVVLLVVLGIAGVLLAAKLAEGMSAQDQAQAELVAMGRIRDALIARAVADASRPGSLPCPDTNNDGEADGSLCSVPYVGRVPWKTLDLPELRDASGDLFWYALSSPYRDHSFAGPLNSDTAGTITVTGSGGVPTTDVVAVIIASHAALAGQTRDPSNAATLTDRTNYLEGENATSPFGADMQFEQQNSSGTFNDMVMPITRGMLMPAVERRVARQARHCLVDYAASAGRYPYAAPMTDTTNYQEVYGQLYGRIPRNLLAGSWPDDSVQNPAVAGTEFCFDASVQWWDYWRELLLYRVAAPFTAAPSGTCPMACLFVNGNSSVEAVVIISGKALNPNPINQTTRMPFASADKQYAQYYLEAASGIDNAVGLSSSRTFVRAAAAGDFNDRLECIGSSTVCN